MNKLLRVALYAVYVMCVLAIITFSNDSYEWISDMDPTIARGSIEDPSNNSKIFAACIFVMVLFVCAAIAVLSKTRSEKVIVIFMTVLASVSYFFSEFLDEAIARLGIDFE